jgi:hypothetical protein
VVAVPEAKKKNRDQGVRWEFCEPKKAYFWILLVLLYGLTLDGYLITRNSPDATQFNAMNAIFACRDTPHSAVFVKWNKYIRINELRHDAPK